MPAHRKLTDTQIQWARELAAKRRDIERQLALLPTMAQAADALGCSERYLTELVAGRARRFLPAEVCESLNSVAA